MEHNNRIKKLIKFNLTITPIVIGGLIYILFGNGNYNFLSWVGFKMSGGLILTNWIIYNLPDGLWLFSLSNIFGFIWSNDYVNFIRWSLFSFLLALLTEIFQKYKLFSGTFDIIDIIAYFIAIIFSSLLFIINYYSLNLNSNRYEKKS